MTPYGDTSTGASKNGSKNGGSSSLFHRCKVPLATRCSIIRGTVNFACAFAFMRLCVCIFGHAWEKTRGRRHSQSDYLFPTTMKLPNEERTLIFPGPDFDEDEWQEWFQAREEEDNVKKQAHGPVLKPWMIYPGSVRKFWSLELQRTRFRMVVQK
ncbi:hypothetical protein EDD18DRAFT_1109728 [Armillaria luteobubalina]|uniref:Uncharacterized protein n=1 Tax=Armillaria luteobubalina TaxID=153913 RepID=A0AA39TI95_9AGAR|nr:hypothetical protein EDD18DRAFT_1109728 [Armillaria luteobubalina]